MRRAALAILLVALLALAGVAPVLGSPQPRPVCGPCGSGLTQFADDPTVRELHPTSSTAIVRIHANGSATWHVTTEAANETAAAHLEEHPAVLEQAVRDSLQYDTIDNEYQDVTATIEGQTITATYVDPEAAYRMPGGILFNEYFHSRGYDEWAVLTADRLTVVGPPETTVTNNPPGADIDGRNATWHGDGDDRVTGAPRVETDAYLAFGDGGAVSQAWTLVGTGLATAPIVLDVMLPFHLPPLVLFGALLAGAMAVAKREFQGAGLGERPVALAVAVIGAILTVAGATGGIFPTFGGTQWVLDIGLVYLVVGGGVYWRGASTRPRDLLATGVLALIIAVVVEILITQGVVQPSLARRSVMEVVRLLPFLIAPIVGVAAVTASRRRAATAWLAMVGSFLVVELAVVWPTQRPFGLAIVVLLFFAIIVLVGSLPLLALGGASTRQATTS